MSFFASLLKKLKSIKGETVVEALAAVLIISSVFVFLASAVMASANINKGSENKNVALEKGVVSGETFSVTISQGASSYHPSATLYETDNGYYYYEP